MSVVSLVEPSYKSFPEWAATDGPAVGQLCSEYAGFTPDPEQQLALDALFAVDATGRSVAFEFAVVCCRQNLKTGLFKMAALGWLFYTDQRLVVWSAHEFRTAQEAFRDMDQLIGSSDYLSKRVKAVYRGNGDESIELFTGQRLIFKARTGSGGRGLTGDKVVLDEAFALQPAHMGALLPTLSARPDPQVVYGSSAGQVSSEVLRAIRDRGRPGGDPSLAYMEYCAPDPIIICADGEACTHEVGRPGCGCDDPANWMLGNPQAGRRISFEYLAAERRALPPAEFGRERMGWWDEPGVEDAALSLRAWTALSDETSTAVPLAYAIEIAEDRSKVSIGMAGQRVDELWHVELFDHFDGTAGLLERCRQLDEANPGIAFGIDEGGPAASEADDLENAGLRVIRLKSADIPLACADMVDAVNQRTIRHGPQDELTAAVVGAKKKSWRDGGFSFGRRVSSVDIGPLVAVTLARHVALTEAPLTHVTVDFG